MRRAKDLTPAWVVVLVFVLTLLGPSPATAAGATAAAPLDLPALAALLATRRSGEATFTEERFVSGIDGPLRASGRLAFEAPSRFMRQTLEPLAETLMVDGERLSLRRGGRTRHLSLDTAPEIAAMVTAVRGTLTGDAAALEQHFIPRVEGDRRQWVLTLQPRDRRLAQQLRELQIAGTGAEVRSVALWMSDGDRSLMTIGPLQAPSADRWPR